MRVLFAAACLAVAVASPAGQQGASLAAARQLYDSASYSDALAMLDTLPTAGVDADQAAEVGKYRAFCLLALGKVSEAQDAVAAILAVKPTFRLGENDASARVFTVFQEARRLALPHLVEQIYERAKRSYDGQQLQQAREGFALVVSLSQDADLPPDAPLVKDLATLARGFLGLIAANAPPLASRPVATRDSIVPATKFVYDGEDQEIVPPVVVEQRLPAWPAGIRAVPGARGVIEVTIDEHGQVESAMMAPPLNPVYDELLLTAARAWRYRPALCGRTPVKYRRRIEVVAGGADGSFSPDGHGPQPAAR